MLSMDTFFCLSFLGGITGQSLTCRVLGQVLWFGWEILLQSNFIKNGKWRVEHPAGIFKYIFAMRVENTPCSLSAF
jgi:hypothetical protein